MPSASIPDRPRAAPCPACGGKAVDAHSPFCSQGCRDRDLLQWLSDGHRIPGPAMDEEDAETAHDGLDS